MDNSSKSPKLMVTVPGSPIPYIVVSSSINSPKRSQDVPLYSTKNIKKSKVVTTQSGRFYDIKKIPPPNSIAQSNYDKLLKEFEDYERLLESGEFSDLKLKVPNNTLSVHRNILAARSPVFAEMLRAISHDVHIKKIEIHDIEFEVLYIVIRFMYCGKLDDLDIETTKKVLTAAKKYSLPGLIQRCNTFIINQISIDNVLDISSFYQSLEEEDVTNYIIDFIRENISQFQETELKKFSSDILAKVIRKFIA